MTAALWLGLLTALCVMPPGVLTQKNGGTLDCRYNETTNKVTIELRIDHSLYPSECPFTTDGKPIFQSSPDGTLPFPKTECPVTSDIRSSACDFDVTGSDSCGCTGNDTSYFYVDYQFQRTSGINQWYTATIFCFHPTLLTQQITFPTCQLPPMPTTTTPTTTTTTTPTTTPDTTAPVRDRHDVTCGQTEMSFSISTADLKFVPQNVTLSDPRCQVGMTAGHLVGRMPLNGCGTSLRLANDSLIFSNFLLFPPSPAVEDNSNITSNIEHIIPIECRYSRVSDLRLSYLPMVRQILFSETGVGQFQFRIDQFHDGSFTSKMADSAYPVKVKPSERVFLQLSLGQWVLKGKERFGMEVERCVASPSPSMMAVHNDSSEELIRDSCPVKRDVQLINSQSAQAMQNASRLHEQFRFSFKPTNVTISSDSASFLKLMYVHCRVRLCAEDACHTSAECAPSALPKDNMKRGKRSVGKRGYTERRSVDHHLSTGPILVAGDDNETPRSSSAALTSPLVVALAALAGVTTLIALAVIAAWTFSRRRGKRNEINYVPIRRQ